MRLFVTLLDGSIQVVPDLLQHLVRPLLWELEDLQTEVLW